MSTPQDKPDKENPGKRVNASGAGSTPTQTQQIKHSGNSGAAQCARLLHRLLDGPVTTTEARRKLDVYDRVRDLRSRGHHIDTLWANDITEAGVSHRVGQYVLIKVAV